MLPTGRENSFYATQKFTPLGISGAFLFVVASAVVSVFGFVVRIESLGMALVVALAGLASLISLPMMLIGRGLVYSAEPPAWSGDAEPVSLAETSSARSSREAAR